MPLEEIKGPNPRVVILKLPAELLSKTREKRDCIDGKMRPKLEHRMKRNLKNIKKVVMV